PAIPPVFSSIVPTDILCHGETTGALDINIVTTVGVPPYVINVERTDVPHVYGTQTTSLPAGTYTVRVTDSKGCFVEESVIISHPDAISPNLVQTNLVCSPTGTELGTITVDATGG